MKPVPPTLKDKKRYIAFRVYGETAITKREVIDAILDETLGFFGENNTSNFGLWVVEFDEEKKEGFLVCNHKYKGEVITALSLIDSVSQRISIQVLGVSGTIKALKRKFLKDKPKHSQLSHNI
jgi:ribonuclease P/MRP protein subunit POP5